jgi:predicted Zn finger-like uncharacterized protein
MSTLTQCPACGTLFKVVSDQLRVSDGWVRCGSCGEAFEARKYFAAALAASETPVVDAAEPQHPKQTAAPTKRQADPVPPPNAIENIATNVQQTPANSPKINKNLGTASTDNVLIDVDDDPTVPWGHSDTTIPGTLDDFASWRDRAPPAQPPIAPAPPAFHALPLQPMPPIPSGEQAKAEAAANHADVGFLREARRRAFWRKPLVRLGLALLAIVLSGVLALQWAYHERDRIAAARPEAIPYLLQMCSHLGCQLRPLRRIDAVVIDQHAFNKFKGDVYRLKVSLKNASNLTVALPAVELTLTDADEQVVGRRVFMPIDLGALSTLQQQLKPGAEFSANLMIQLGRELSAEQGSKRVAGYSVYTFYP